MINKTWANFIDHFRQAHQELRDTDTTINQLGFHSANAIVKQIVDCLREEDDTRMRVQNEFHTVQPTPTPGYEMSPPPGFDLSPPPAPPTVAHTPILDPPQANAVLSTDLNTAVLKDMMRSMQLLHDNMHQTFRQGRGRGYRRGRGRGRNGQR